MIRNYGLTLIELLAGLMIIGIVFALCIPLGFSLYGKNQLKLLENEIGIAIRFARNMALLKHVPLVLTPLPSSDNWSDGMILFIDNKNHQYAETDEIIHQWNWQKLKVQVSWVGFRSNNYLLFSSTLSHSASNGHFILRNNEGNTVKLVINRLGRVAAQKQDNYLKPN
ncbi:Tfp type 4 fimbrial pilin related signal peptide protein domain protein [Legionella nautarum]|uniref:Type II secretion system protein H n=1 Tax=Legionella nautarum TaxID=45070 RepID=A0A0W0WV81_9GAMM|nr:GspH/FimT family pseudopilin [Legionella nautarum]KTD36209.1 Tfp type 4 fimbrial pilin related signal peptide protein domain protein [Legionella nautarum]